MATLEQIHLAFSPHVANMFLFALLTLVNSLFYSFYFDPPNPLFPRLPFAFFGFLYALPVTNDMYHAMRMSVMIARTQPRKYARIIGLAWTVARALGVRIGLRNSHAMFSARLELNRCRSGVVIRRIRQCESTRFNESLWSSLNGSMWKRRTTWTLLRVRTASCLMRTKRKNRAATKTAQRLPVAKNDLWDRRWRKERLNSARTRVGGYK